MNIPWAETDSKENASPIVSSLGYYLYLFQIMCYSGFIILMIKESIMYKYYNYSVVSFILEDYGKCAVSFYFHKYLIFR